MEEIYLEGPLGNTDIRIINSYPSKVVSRLCGKSPKVRPKSPAQKSQTCFITNRQKYEPCARGGTETSFDLYKRRP